MTPTDMREVRTGLALTQKDMASVLCLSLSAVRGYEYGTVTPSATVAMLYEELAAGWRPMRLRAIRKERAARKRERKR